MSKQNRLKKLFKVGIILILLVGLVLFVFQSDIDQVFYLISNIGWGFLWIIVITLVAFLCGTLSWRYTLPTDVNISFWRLYYIRLIGENIGLINPSNIVGGDAMKAYLLDAEGVDYTQSAASLILSRLIMIVVQILMFFVVALLFYIVSDIHPVLKDTMMYLSMIFLCSAVGIYAILRMGWLNKVLAKTNLTRGYWAKRIKSVGIELHSFYLHEKTRFLKSIFWAAINFLIGSLEFIVIFYFLGYSVSYLEALLVDQGVLVLKSFGAFIPGQIGVEEYANKLMFGIIGIHSASIWVAASVLRRSRQLFWIIISIVLYYGHKISWRRLFVHSSIIQ